MPRGMRTTRRDASNPRLRIGTHNAFGMVGTNAVCRAIPLSDHWHHLELDVVLVTETHATANGAANVESRLDSHNTASNQSAAWHYLWGYTDSRASRGVAILVRKHLYTSGQLQIIKQYDINPITNDLDGTDTVQVEASSRILAFQVQWGGHKMQLACIYMPNDAPTQRIVIQQCLHHLHAAAVTDGCIPVWGGDWNFVEQASLDRLSARVQQQQLLPSPPLSSPMQQQQQQPPPPPPQPTQQQQLPPPPPLPMQQQQQQVAALVAAVGHPPPPQDAGSGRQSSAKELHHQCPGLLDMYRVLHPSKCTYTYFKRAANDTHVGSRIDRFYVEKAMQTYIKQCTMPTHVSSISDHRVLTLDLLPRLPIAQGAGLRRYRVTYAKSRILWGIVDDWLALELASMPAAQSPAAVLQWWPGFKQRFAAQIQQASMQARRAACNIAAQLKQQQRAVDAAAATAMRHDSPAAAMRQFAQAEANYRDAVRAQALIATTAMRQQWIHSREVPSPAFSAMLRPPQECRQIPALTNPSNGNTTADPKSMARIMVKFWANISAEPTINAESSNAVLHTLRSSHSTRLPAAAAAAAGAECVTEKEVTNAIKRMASGRSPGVDGLPVEAYRTHRKRMAPVLATLFTAIGLTRDTPKDFLMGAITFLHKKGPKSDPANYRPITLLNSDYRTLARILATRLGPVLGKAVDREQCAFLPGRRIGEVVQLLQLLPELLKRQDQEAVVAFMDFSKAYDTVSRPFLFAAMEAMGAGGGLLSWARILLNDTQARAVVNGHPSAPATFLAGVRQGCPLSPLLYLFVAQALLTWLKSRGLGISVGTRRITAAQYADDCTTLLSSLGVLPTFNTATQVFAQASGQHLNPTKTQLLRIGKLSPGPVASTHPYVLTTEAETLGIRFSNAALSPAALKAYWQSKLQPAYACLDKLAKMPLSTFGRAFGAGGYALSTILYHAEFMGLPPATLLRQLTAKTAAVVDRKGGRLTGVPGSMLIGRPAEGGFGLMPLELHVKARHAWWALALLRAPLHGWPPPPWVLVARALIASIRPAASPFTLLNQRHLEAAAATPAGQWHQRDSLYADEFAAYPPAHRLLTALQIADIERFKLTASPKLGKWIRHAPIWSNPMLWDRNQYSPEWKKYFAMQSFLRNTAATVGDSINAVDLSALAVSQSIIPNFTFFTRHPELCATRNVNRYVEEENLYELIPQQWRQWCQGPAAPLQPQLGPPGWQAEAQILQHMRFSCFPLQGFDPLPAISVRKLTAVQMHIINSPRFQRFKAYATEAGDSDPAAAAKRLKKDIFRQVWSLPWENKYKEIFWRLAVHGVAMYGSSRYRGTDQPPLPCLCGRGPVSRMHHFWECPIATAVMQEVQLGRNPAAAATTAASSITREQVWLLQAPPRVSHDIWQVVVLAALNAMDVGRRRLTSVYMTANQQHPTNQPPPSPEAQQRNSATAEQLQLACVFATERFWSNLRDFAVLNHCRPPKRWVSQLSSSPAHPFFEVQQLPEQQQQQQEQGGQREWRLYAKARPPSIVLPDVL